MAFSPSAKRIIFPQWISGEFFRHENTPQIGMTLENDTEHVVDLAFQPVRPLPQRTARRKQQVRHVQESLHIDTFCCRRVEESINYAEAIASIGIVKIIDRGYVDQHIEAAILFQALQNGKNIFRSNMDPAIVPKLGSGESLWSKSLV